MKNLKINHLAVIVGLVVLSGFGALWYGPLFGDPWMELVGLSMADIEADPPGAGTWITNALAIITPLYVMAWLFSQLSVESLMRGALLGALFGFAFAILPRIVSGLFAQDPYWLAWLNGGYNTIAFAIGGAILGGWRKYSK
ncbi:MAG: DUF1761 domain-containing protein [Bacteroidota bacterium]